MSVALLLVTHSKIATGMMETVCSIVNSKPTNYACVEIPMDTPVDVAETEILDKINQLDTDSGILVLTDMYGGTPSNIAMKCVSGKNARIISGLNLPMLVRIMNYRNAPLKDLSDKVVTGGQQCIMQYEDKPD